MKKRIILMCIGCLLYFSSMPLSERRDTKKLADVLFLIAVVLFLIVVIMNAFA